jgi:rod shape-determining protein MreD
MKLEASKKRKYTRRTVMALLLAGLGVAQNVPLLPVFYGARAYVLIPFAVCVAALDTPSAAILYAAIAGAAWDFTSSPHGFHAIYFTCIAFAVSMLLRYVMNYNFWTMSLFLLVSVAGEAIMRWLANYAAPGIPGMGQVFMTTFLPSCVYTLALTPFVFLLVRRIVRVTSKKRGGVVA